MNESSISIELYDYYTFSDTWSNPAGCCVFCRRSMCYSLQPAAQWWRMMLIWCRQRLSPSPISQCSLHWNQTITFICH